MNTRSRVKVLGGVLIGHGILQIALIALALLAGFVDEEFERQHQLASLYLGLALYFGFCAFQVLVGWWTLDVRHRVVAIVTVSLGLVCSLTSCCPLSLLVAVFGLWVLLDQNVARAFRRRAEGASAEDALADRDSASEIAAVFDLEDAADPERSALDQDVAEALIAILPDDWDEAFLRLRRDSTTARLMVVIHDGSGNREIRPDAALLDVLGALDEYVQASGGFLRSTTLHLRDANGWRYEWVE